MEVLKARAPRPIAVLVLAQAFLHLAHGFLEPSFGRFTRRGTFLPNEVGFPIGRTVRP